MCTYLCGISREKGEKNEMQGVHLRKEPCPREEQGLAGEGAPGVSPGAAWCSSPALSLSLNVELLGNTI